jgi:hypothetical protein
MWSTMLIVTEDVPDCPGCGAPAVRLGDRQRHCNGCGLDWERMTEADELDAKADREVRSRAAAEERGTIAISKHQTRW